MVCVKRNFGTVHVAGPVPGDIAPGCILTFVAWEKNMNQVAVVIGGGRSHGAFLCRGLAEEGYGGR